MQCSLVYQMHPRILHLVKNASVLFSPLLTDFRLVQGQIKWCYNINIKSYTESFLPEGPYYPPIVLLSPCGLQELATYQFQQFKRNGHEADSH